jgi:hypothetical protein
VIRQPYICEKRNIGLIYASAHVFFFWGGQILHIRLGGRTNGRFNNSDWGIFSGAQIYNINYRGDIFQFSDLSKFPTPQMLVRAI